MDGLCIIYLGWFYLFLFLFCCMNEEIANKSGNKLCVICGGKNPSWGCFPFGVLVCTKCAGGMRELGTDCCVVKSLLLDSVSSDFLVPFFLGSNFIFIDWMSKRGIEEISVDFFKSKLAKEFSSDLSTGKIKEKEIKSAPVLEREGRNPSVKIKKKSKLKIAEEKTGEEKEEEKEEKEEEKEELAGPVKKRVVKRVSGKSVAGELSDSSRLGMFKKGGSGDLLNGSSEMGCSGKNEKVTDSAGSTPSSFKKSSIHKYSGSNFIISGSEDEKKEVEIVKGKNFIGSAPVAKETVSEKLKKKLEKGKNIFLNRFMK